MTNMNKEKIREICRIASDRIRDVHIGCFKGTDKPLFLISETYPGIWMEHVYDSVFYASRNPEYLCLAENTVNLFMDRQTEEGQLPFAVMRSGSTRITPPLPPCAVRCYGGTGPGPCPPFRKPAASRYGRPSFPVGFRTCGSSTSCCCPACALFHRRRPGPCRISPRVLR